MENEIGNEVIMREKELSSFSYQNSANSSFSGHRIKISTIETLIPNLTDGGKRSLLHVMKKSDLINSERVLGVTTIGITQHGIKALEKQFPVLSNKWSSWTGNWDCLVFVKPPSSDHNFRFLRNLLVEEGAISISRGVYISPGSFSDRVVADCSDIYRNSVLMFSVGEWKIASFRNLIVAKYNLIDLVESYSGISNDVSRLLTYIDTNKRLTNSSKIDINLVYDRLIDVLGDDPGFSHYYFNDSPKPLELISKLNYLVTSL